MPGFVHRLWLRLTTKRSPELPGNIAGTTTGVEFISEAGKLTSIPWSDVEEIYAYKKDCFVNDQIRMEIYSKTPEIDILITEDTAGFDEFQNLLSKQYPSIDAEWINKIIQPPFATNTTLLYKRSKEA